MTGLANLPKNEAWDVRDVPAPSRGNELGKVPNNKRILIAEDNPSIAETYKMFLESYGYEVILAANGLECIKKFDDLVSSRTNLGMKGFKIIVLDYHLPGKDGIDIAKYISSVSPSERILIASSYPEEVIQKSAQGLECAVELLLKPFDLDSLLDVVEGRSVTLVVETQNVIKDDKSVHAGLSRMSMVQIEERSR